jgi:uncharacterized protein
MFGVDDQAAGPHDAALDHERLVLEARDVEFDWSKLPVHYVPGEPFVTHVLNVLHLLLPAGEEFFVQAFKKSLPLIRDDQLRLDVQGFIGQEAVHSQAHATVLANFAAQGVDVTPYTDQIRWLFEKVLGERPERSLRDPTTPYSCRQGCCGTCQVKVHAGQVDHRGRTAVGDDEMLVCVSRAKGHRVVIDA